MLTLLTRRSRSSLVVTILFAASCGGLSPDAGESQDDVLSANGLSMNGLSMNGLSMNGLSMNGLSMNGLSMNGLSMNGLSMNGLSMNGLSMNGLETVGGLSSTSGLMTTEGGREVIKYLVKIAYPAGSSLTTQDQYGQTYTFDGSLGVAPQFESGTCDVACQEAVSGAMLAHVNNSGMHVSIWLVGPDNGIGWGSSPNFPYKEAAYFGNLFTSNMPGNYCSGKDMGSGDSKGRLGSPFGNNGSVLKAAYGEMWDGASQQNVPQYCYNANNSQCLVMNEGYSQCADFNGVHGGPWMHPVTVWRNFESTQLYKICNKYGKCLGVVGGSTANGANIEQRTYAGAAGQTWKILQVSPGVYKIINKTSGMSLDVNGTQVVQRPYTTQAFPLRYLSNEPGFANLQMSSNPGVVFWNNYSGSDGGLIQTTNNFTADPTKWSFTAIALDTFDPGMTYRLTPQSSLGSAIDVSNNGATTNGTSVQQYSWWSGNGQKFFVADAGHGNVTFKMKNNPAKCLGPRANGTFSGTPIEVQDCNGSYNQAWISGQVDAAPGTFMFKNAAAPTKCLDVAGNTTNNTAPLELYTCNGANNQLFAATVAP